MFKGHFTTGTVEGTGAAINVQLGFTPSKVVIYNIDDAGALSPSLTWVSGMAAASGWKTLSIADNGTTTKKSSEYITADGISAYAGTAAGDSAGFTIGADADLNVSAETIVYEAFGEE